MEIDISRGEVSGSQHASSFHDFRSYLRAISDTPNRFLRRAFSASTSSDEMARARLRSGSTMKRTLRWYDLVGLGLGGMVGAGVFVTTGHAARLLAGPAVVISYAISGVCALLSALCYTEFAVDMPVAGGAFSYIRVTLGEFPAFLAGANLIGDYVLSNAAVARGFTAYLSTALGLSGPNRLRFTIRALPDGYNQMDLIAVALVLLLTLVICYRTRESSWLNMALTALHLGFIVFVIAMGFWRGQARNFTHPGDPKDAGGFFPFGASGVFDGAAMVYLSYIGYDAVSTMAEEVRDPVRDIPIGVSGSVILVTLLYCLMAASMTALLPYDMIDPEAPFSGALKDEWASKVIGVGASFGISTSILVAMLGQARYMCVIGRSGVVPTWFARVHPSTSTPLNASLFLGICTALIAVFTDLNILLNLVSIGTLFVFYMVANAVIFRRYVARGPTKPWPTLAFLLCFTLTSIIFTLVWQFGPSGRAKAIMLGSTVAFAIAVVQLFHFLARQARRPEFWGVPLMPWIPCVSIFLNIFLLGSLDGPSYARFGIFSGLTVLLYILYSVHSSFDADTRGALARDENEGISMKEYDGGIVISGDAPKV